MKKLLIQLLEKWHVNMNGKHTRNAMFTMNLAGKSLHI